MPVRQLLASASTWQSGRFKAEETERDSNTTSRLAHRGCRTVPAGVVGMPCRPRVPAVLLEAIDTAVDRDSARCAEPARMLYR